MSGNAVPEICEAVALFEAWERSIGDAEGARRFTEAVQLLDEYLELEPGTPHRHYIENLRVSNTRRLLQQLAKVERQDLSLWLEYAIAVVSVVGDEAQSLMAANPQLKADFDAFAKVWGGAVQEALQRFQRGEG